MRLTRAGIQNEAEEPVTLRGAAELLRYWYDQLESIDADFAMGDLVALLEEVEDIGLLSPLLGCNPAAFLAEAREAAEPLEDVFYLEVSNQAELSEYQPDPQRPDEPLRWLDDDEAAAQDRMDRAVADLTGDKPPHRLVDATGDDPITGRPALVRLQPGGIHGSWKTPYVITRDFHGWGLWGEPYSGYFAAHPEIDPARYGGAVSLDFAPMGNLLHLPLRYNPRIRFESRDGYPETLQFETEVTITFGEFIRAIFWEIGFHGTPETRDAALAELEERLEVIRREEERGDHGDV